MAKFGEKLFDFKEVLKSCRIPVSCVGDRWFLNVGKNSVVNVHDQKTLHTWTLMHPHYFTSSVVHSEGNLYCVMDENVLLKWSTKEDNLKNAEKIKFQDSVFTVIPLDGLQPLVLFDSGKYAIIETTFCNTKLSDFVFLNKNEELVWADACATAEDIEVFCLAQNKKDQNRIFYNYSIKKENGSTSHLRSYRNFRKNANLKSWCLNHNNLLILTLWSDGMICSHSIKESQNTDLLFIKEIETDNSFGIDSIDSTHIVLATGDAKKEECVLEIWDLKCAVMKASKILRLPNLSSIQIAAVNSNIFLCFNKDLISVVFHIEDPTFYAALGMSEGNKFVQHSWDTDLELFEFSSLDEPEAMDICSTNQDSLQLITEKLLNKDSPDLMCIPESELVKLLLFAVRHEKSCISDRKLSEKDLYSLINIIFSASFNDILLIKYLKKMNLEETLSVLKLLLSYLNHTIFVAPNMHKRPSDLQIVNWTCLIIQSHTEALLFSKDKTTRRLLKQLEKATSVKVDEYEDFDCIQSYFCIIEKKDMLPQKCSDGKYCIDNLEI